MLDRGIAIALGRIKPGADDAAGPHLAPGEELRGRGPDNGHGEDRAHGRPHRLDRIGIHAVADQDHAAAAGGIRCADDGAQIARIAHLLQRHPGRSRARQNGRQGRIDLIEHAQHGLWIVAAADFFENGMGHHDHFTAAGPRRFAGTIEDRMRPGVLADQQQARAAVLIQRLADEFQPLGEEPAGGLALLAHVQGADGLDRVIGQRGDQPVRHAGHWADQRAKKLRPMARPAGPSSARASSPQSMVPPRSAVASAIRCDSDRPEMRAA